MKAISLEVDQILVIYPLDGLTPSIASAALTAQVQGRKHVYDWHGTKGAIQRLR